MDDRLKWLTSDTNRWPGLVCLLLALLLLGAPVMAADILLTARDDSEAVRSFSEALSQQRPQDHIRFQTFDTLPLPGQLPANTRLILLDTASLDWRLQDTKGPPTLVLRISRLQAHQRLGEDLPPRLSLLWSDPPLARQLRLIRKILPQARRIGVLYGRESQFLLTELRQAAKPMGLEIVAQNWGAPYDSRALQSLLKNSDVLLGLDDPALYNPRTAKNLLLSSYARQQALIGPNASFVKAGSLASTYSDQQDWLLILASLLDQPPSSWPRALYPPRFKVSSNPQVARSLGIEEIDEQSVAAGLAEGELHP